MKKLLSIFTFLLIALVSFAQNDDSIFIRRIADEILMNGKAYDDLHFLTKQIGGRLAGSPQMPKAEQWGLKTLQSLNPDKAWLQQCMVPHWVRGGKDEANASFSGKKKVLDVIALGNSKGSGKSGVTGNVIEVKSFDELEAKKDQLKNKIVFYNYPFNQKGSHLKRSGPEIQRPEEGACRGVVVSPGSGQRYWKPKTVPLWSARVGGASVLRQRNGPDDRNA